MKARVARLIILSFATFTVFTRPNPSFAIAPPREYGKEPPALTPYAPNDPIPKLNLRAHSDQKTPRQAIESFLAYLSDGLNISSVTYTGGTVPGLSDGYEKAWALLDDNRPSLQDFKRQWAETVRLGVVQLEPVNDTRYFVELERLHLCGDHWAVAYYFGELTTAKTQGDWRIRQFEVKPENLVAVNLGGHQAWIHHIQPAALAMTGQGWEVQAVRYEKRIASVEVTNNATGQNQTLWLARLVEGSWVPLKGNRGR
jgi:hypothetical protein